MDQNCFTASMMYLHEHNLKIISMMIYRMTPPKQKATNMVNMATDIKLLRDLFTCFVNNNACQDFKDSLIPSDV